MQRDACAHCTPWCKYHCATSSKLAVTIHSVDEKREQTLVGYKLNTAELCCHSHEETAAVLVRDLRESSHRPHQRKRWRQEHITVRSLRPFHSKFTRSRPSMDTAHATNRQIKKQRNVFLTFDARVYQKRQQNELNRSTHTPLSLSGRLVLLRRSHESLGPMSATLACFARLFSERTGDERLGCFQTSHERHTAVGYG